MMKIKQNKRNANAANTAAQRYKDLPTALTAWYWGQDHDQTLCGVGLRTLRTNGAGPVSAARVHGAHDAHGAHLETALAASHLVSYNVLQCLTMSCNVLHLVSNFANGFHHILFTTASYLRHISAISPWKMSCLVMHPCFDCDFDLSKLHTFAGTIQSRVLQLISQFCQSVGKVTPFSSPGNICKHQSRPRSIKIRRTSPSFVSVRHVIC